MGLEIACPRCGARFEDATGQYAAFARLAGEGRIGLLIGCTGCHLLFAPAGGARSESRYEIVRELGRGGMGVTLVAFDRTAQRTVCIKRLHPTVDARALRQEWQALAAVDHPTIVQLRDYYEEAGSPHLVMELVDGVALDRLLRAGPLPLWVAVDVAAQICDALAAIHDRAIIHRDLKPGNVLVEWRDTRLVPRIVDFGIAIVGGVDMWGVKTGIGNIAGTPVYMAPEQVQGAMCTPAADVYAAGMVLAEMLVGPSSLAAHSLDELVQRKLQLDGIELPPGGCPREIAELVRAMTRRDPAERLTARAAAGALRALVPRTGERDLLAPINLDLARTEPTGWPVGWSNGVGIVDGISDRFAVRVDHGTLAVTAPADASRELFGTAMQRVYAGHLAGERVTFSAELATEDCGWAALWLRADAGDGRALHFDNMSDRPIRGTTAAARHAIEVTLPPATTWLNFGVLLVGEGRVIARRLTLASTRRSLAIDTPPPGDDPTSLPLT